VEFTKTGYFCRGSIWRLIISEKINIAHISWNFEVFVQYIPQCRTPCTHCHCWSCHHMRFDSETLTISVVLCPILWKALNSASIVSGYGLDDRAIEIPSLAEAKGFFLYRCVHTGSGAHPASCPMGSGGPFPGAKARPGRNANHSAHLVPRSRMSISPLHPSPSWRVVGQL
jgi:hypothetical protein